MASVAIVIPARLASTRLPGKMLLRETGKPLIQHTWEQVKQADVCARGRAAVWIAADGPEVANAARQFGANVVVTDASCRCGTDRAAEAARMLPFAEVVVNVQGDEPEVSPSAIDEVVKAVEQDARRGDVPSVNMATAAVPLRSWRNLHSRSCVKVVINDDCRAMYFSRGAIPFARDWRDELLTENPPHFHQHLGVYAFRRRFLFEFAAARQSDLEQLEGLEQLRAISLGEPIRVVVLGEEHASEGVDTHDDYMRFVGRWKQSQQGQRDNGRRTNEPGAESGGSEFSGNGIGGVDGGEGEADCGSAGEDCGSAGKDCGSALEQASAREG